LGENLFRIRHSITLILSKSNTGQFWSAQEVI
jgi:hypothetical protein